MVTPNLTPNEARRLEGYAAALQDIQKALTGESWCCKTYDPLTVDLDKDQIRSYAYDLISGGRLHPLSEFADADDIKRALLNEVVRNLLEAIDENEVSDFEVETLCSSLAWEE